jgi:SurA N-terminal domain
MKAALQFALALLIMANCPAQVVVDRMAAVVNKRVILESELDQAARVEYLTQGKPLTGGNLSSPELLAVLEQLIDRSLLEQQMVHPEMVAPQPEEMAARLKEVRERIPGASDEERWKAMLAAYGVTQQDVEEHLASEFRVLRLVDLRFRGLVRVDKGAIAGYYQDQFVPELKRRGATPPALDEVAGKIEKILVEQRVNDMLNEWLQALRTQAHIERMMPAATNPPAGAHP